MKIDLSKLVQELAVLPHTPVEHNEVSAYVLTHIFAPLREKHKVMFADLDFSAFTEEDLDALRGMLSDEEERLNRLLRSQPNQKQQRLGAFAEGGTDGRL